jgi:hypothetical protein
MTIPQLTAALESVGATPEQAADLAEIMHATWHGVPYYRLSAEDLIAMKQWLHDWIAQNQEQAAIVRKQSTSDPEAKGAKP